MIKVEEGARTHLASRAIGAGIQNVLFADVRSLEDAEQCVAAVRADTPQTGGTYGASDRRIAGFGEGDTPAYVQALEDVICFTFSRWYLGDFMTAIPDEKMPRIIEKTARKMSAEARARAVTVDRHVTAGDPLDHTRQGLALRCGELFRA